MNANELADELETRYKYEEASECMLDAATMLRQQQEALDISEKLCGKALANLEEKDKTISQQQTEIEVLKAILRKAQEK